MKKLVLGIGLLLSVQSAFADDWISIGKGADDIEHFLSAQYIKHSQTLGGKNLDVWSKSVYKKNLISKNGLSFAKGEYVLSLHNIDCQNRMMGSERYVYYYPNGAMRISGDYYQPKTPVAPNSAGEALVKNACSLYGW